jgi:hypothetical protein
MKVGDREGGEIEEGKRELMKKMRESEGGGKCWGRWNCVMEVAIRREVGEMREVGYFEGIETLRWREVGRRERMREIGDSAWGGIDWGREWWRWERGGGEIGGGWWRGKSGGGRGCGGG